jgi:hypothetical protein
MTFELYKCSGRLIMTVSLSNRRYHKLRQIDLTSLFSLTMLGEVSSQSRIIKILTIAKLLEWRNVICICFQIEAVI